MIFCGMDTMAGGIFHVRSKILVHTHRHLARRDIEAVMLEHLLLLILISDLVTGLL